MVTNEIVFDAQLREDIDQAHPRWEIDDDSQGTLGSLDGFSLDLGPDLHLPLLELSTFIHCE
jgi:hypothetical protein